MKKVAFLLAQHHDTELDLGPLSDHLMEIAGRLVQ